MMKKLFAVIAILAAFSIQVNAHYLWIELGAAPKTGKEQEIHIYYGEFNEGVREVKGGRLEELQGIVAWVIAPDGKQIPLKITTENKFFRSTFTPQYEGKYVIVAVNTIRDVVHWSMHGIGVVRPVYYTTREVVVGGKSNFSGTHPKEAELTISLIPEKKNTYSVSFRGKALPNAKVLFHAPNEWSKELRTDKDGVVEFNPLWKGQYIIECIYAEKTPGTFNGKDYEAIRHRATLALDIQ